MTSIAMSGTHSRAIVPVFWLVTIIESGKILKLKFKNKKIICIFSCLGVSEDGMAVGTGSWDSFLRIWN